MSCPADRTRPLVSSDRPQPPIGSGPSVAATLVPSWDRRWAVDAVELDRPSTARLHDALLGGDYHFGVDRRLATRLAATVPGLTRALYAERYFLDRAIRLCLGEGIRQFLDLGCGLPTVGNARAVIHRRAPTARVGCVDLDPVVIATLAGDLIDEDRAAIGRGA